LSSRAERLGTHYCNASKTQEHQPCQLRHDHSACTLRIAQSTIHASAWRDELLDLQAISLELAVNDQVRPKSNTADMNFQVARPSPRSSSIARSSRRKTPLAIAQC